MLRFALLCILLLPLVFCDSLSLSVCFFFLSSQGAFYFMHRRRSCRSFILLSVIIFSLLTIRALSFFE